MRIPFLRVLFLGVLILTVASVVSAFAAGISISAANAGQQSVPLTAEDIKPAACASVSLTNIVRGNGTLTGTTGNDLIIGSAAADIIDGLGGNDCILGGGSDDSLIGNDGDDICLGGVGTDIFTDCETEIQ
jgi:Ca2+-binding RTX toxin-like protein